MQSLRTFSAFSSGIEMIIKGIMLFFLVKDYKSVDKIKNLLNCKYEKDSQFKENP